MEPLRGKRVGSTQPVDCVRPVVAPDMLGLGLPRVRLLGNAAQSEWETPSKAKYNTRLI